MATFTWTYMPIVAVLKNGGSINLIELSEKLNKESQRHFKDLAHVEWVIKNYSGCLKIEDGDRVRFDRQATKYAKLGIMERDIDYQLHQEVPDMKFFELYPHINHNNSTTCPLGIPWENIPKDERGERVGNPYRNCNFRSEGEDGCRLGCRVSEDIVNKFLK